MPASAYCLVNVIRNHGTNDFRFTKKAQQTGQDIPCKNDISMSSERRGSFPS